jgi:hypothetical protein
MRQKRLKISTYPEVLSQASTQLPPLPKLLQAVTQLLHRPRAWDLSGSDPADEGVLR